MGIYRGRKHIDRARDGQGSQTHIDRAGDGQGSQKHRQSWDGQGSQIHRQSWGWTGFTKIWTELGMDRVCAHMDLTGDIDRIRIHMVMDIAEAKQGLPIQGHSWGWTGFANTLTDLGMDRVANTGTELGMDRVANTGTELGMDRVR